MKPWAARLQKHGGITAILAGIGLVIVAMFVVQAVLSSGMAARPLEALYRLSLAALAVVQGLLGGSGEMPAEGWFAIATLMAITLGAALIFVIVMVVIVRLMRR